MSIINDNSKVTLIDSLYIHYKVLSVRVKYVPIMELLITDMNEIDKLLKEFGVGRRSIDDSFFDHTYKYCKVFERKGVTVEDEEELCHEL